MAIDTKEFLDIKVDVGVMKEQIATLTSLCGKMDNVIDRLVEQNDNYINQIYKDMDKRRLETEQDVNEVHTRIDTVLDKMSATELRLLEEIKSLRKDMLEHNKQEKEAFDKLLQWKWMIVGGIIVISWLTGHFDFDTMSVLTKH
ncbi:hypothetical protein UFOVP250_126 [uncultured Caudovirales phage]|uniref:Uncharacterized protein n=1 Tax=uncultured Caudovirales phage TaxID=2100421 RepID=A0A6J5LF65_9CAUD|nr:hypothetical protein UFOVP250_126 [uncultured Caudovirales phage]